MPLYKAFNGAAPTTAAQVPVTTGTSIKTLLQLSTPSTARIKIKEWGISFDGTTTNTPIRVELVETDVAATVTAYGAGDIVKFDTGDPATLLTLGTAASGFTSTVEGTVAATREFDVQFVAPTNQYAWQWPLGDEPIVAVSKFLRVRVTAGAAVNAYCWVKWLE